jgi:hypothetical protein
MKALLVLFARVRRPHDDLVRANQFNSQPNFSPYLAMLPMVRQ